MDVRSVGPGRRPGKMEVRPVGHLDGTWEQTIGLVSLVGSVGLFRQPGFDAGSGPPVHHAALDGLVQLGIGLAEEPGRRFGVRVRAQALDGGSEGGLDRGVAPLTDTFLAQTLFG